LTGRGERRLARQPMGLPAKAAWETRL